MNDKDIKLPFCAVFGIIFIHTLTGIEGETLNLKTRIKTKKIITNYFISQLSSPSEYNQYIQNNREEFSKFAE